MKRLTQNDNSEDFYIKIKFSNQESNEIQIRTTQNKARVISNKINEMYQIDPTITEYEMIIPTIFNQNKKNNTEEELRMILTNIEILLKSTTEKVNITQNDMQQINILQRLLGENSTKNSITMSSINESISYLSTEFHQESIEYLSSHLIELIKKINYLKLIKKSLKKSLTIISMKQEKILKKIQLKKKKYFQK